jgi:hypothetical protein
VNPEGALEAVATPDGKGGTDAWQPNSSLALAIDVFGTLKLVSERHAILDQIATLLRG